MGVESQDFEQWWQDQMTMLRGVSFAGKETIVPGSTLGPSAGLSMEELEVVRQDLQAFESLVESEHFDLLVWACLTAGDEAATRVWRQCWDAYKIGLWPADHIRDLAAMARQEAMRATLLAGLSSLSPNPS